MAKVADAKTANPNSAGWFKVSEGGLMSNNPDYFAVQVLNVRFVSSVDQLA
jgi:cellulase